MSIKAMMFFMIFLSKLVTIMPQLKPYPRKKLKCKKAMDLKWNSKVNYKREQVLFKFHVYKCQPMVSQIQNV